MSDSTERTVEAGNRIVLRRRYEAAVADVWDACTSPERVARWIGPVSGDLRVGGSFQIEGNASGRILRCEPPRLLRVTWVFGETPVSKVELRLSSDGDGTLLELEHAGRDWEGFGPGGIGVGWDLALLGLGLHLSGRAPGDTDAAASSARVRAFIVTSATAWAAAFEASGASAAQAAAATRQTLDFYTVPEEEARGAPLCRTRSRPSSCSRDRLRYGPGEAGPEGTQSQAQIDQLAVSRGTTRTRGLLSSRRPRSTRGRMPTP